MENWAAPYVLVMTTLLLVICAAPARRAASAPSSRQPSKFPTSGEFLAVFVPSVTAMVGFWATLSLNMPDFTRYGALAARPDPRPGRSAFRRSMTVFAVRSASSSRAPPTIVFGATIWDPIDPRRQNSIAACSSPSPMLAVALSTLATNIAANIVAAPPTTSRTSRRRKIYFAAAACVTGVLGILMLPWKLIADPQRVHLQVAARVLGGPRSIAGVLVCDYWIDPEEKFELADLYRPDGSYPAVRWEGVIATGVGCLLAWIGLIVPCSALFDHAWFVGALGSGVTYWALMQRR